MSIRGRRIAAVTFLLGLLVLLGGWLVVWQPFAGSSDGKPVTVVIERGSGVNAVGTQLERQGVIDSAALFALHARIAGETDRIHAGTLTLRQGMSYAEALEALTADRPPTPVRTVTIPEGPSRQQVARLAAREGIRGDYLKASRSSPTLAAERFGAPANSSLEGFLFPSTYELRLPPTAEALVSAQVAAFRRNLARVDLSRARAKNLTVFDVVTIASMVERETADPDERRLIAAVIWNRLHQRMPLGIDATTRYEFDNWTKPLLQSQLESPSGWNTRTHIGLPPGPIGNPGLASLQAAANPADSKALFYVVKPWACGKHSFSTTQAQFDADVAAYNRARTSNGGRAPTRCP